MKWTLVFNGLLLISASSSLPNKKIINKPNIIVYLTDDQGFGEINNPLILTPNLKKFALEGMTLTHTYTVPICGPSRWSALTGSNEVQGNGVDGQIPIPNITLPKSLQNLGYYTGIIGKYAHGGYRSISSAEKMGFNYSFVYPTHIAAHVFFIISLEENNSIVKFKRTYAPDLFASRALKFINQHAHENFFLWWAPNLPHVGKYKSSDKINSHIVTNYANYRSTRWTREQKGHASMITNYIDRDIGYLLTALKQLKIDNNTLVLFASDNGADNLFNIVNFFKANGNLRGAKREIYEGGVRVPAIIRWPGKIAANTTNNIPWKLQDLLPTFTEIAGKKITKPHTESVGLFWLKPKNTKPATYININYCQRNQPPCQWAFYDYTNFPESLKLLYNKQNLELYNLTNDPGEKNNLRSNPELQEKIQDLLNKRNKYLL